MKLINRAYLQPAVELFSESVKASREHSALAKRALEKYGDHGSQISGIVREHFPENVKTQLRALARKVTEKSDAAYAIRPRGVRHTTMRKLAAEVAERDGSGFYGPQATRKGNPVKKKRARSPAQRANDKRLGEMAKARAGQPKKTRPGPRPRKMNPRGKQPKQYIVFRATESKYGTGWSVKFLTPSNRWSGRSIALHSSSKSYLTRIARTSNANGLIGVAEATTPTSAIVRKIREVGEGK
jgi:hypothetical protein